MVEEKRGGISIRILFVVFTLIIIGLSVYFLLEMQRKTYKINHRKAIELCEYGFQLCMEQLYEKIQNDPTKLTGIAKTEYNDGWYKVDVSTSRENDFIVITITSMGYKGTQVATKKEIINLTQSEIDGKIIWKPQKKNENVP